MADEQSSNTRSGKAASSDDVMHGRNLEGAEYGATEREQTRDRERVVRGDKTDEIGEVADAEIEARENSGGERGTNGGQR
jgi:hypothetical protein